MKTHKAIARSRMLAVVVILIIVAAGVYVALAPNVFPTSSTSITSTSFPTTTTTSPTTTSSLTTTSTGPTPNNASVLTVALTTWPTSFDPAYSTSGWMYDFSREVYQGLVQFNGTSVDRVIPVLATSWTASADGLKYTFNIRQGVYFHDGTTLDANAVAFSFNRSISIGLSPGIILSYVKSVAAVNSSTVAFTLKNPNANFLFDLATLPAWIIVSPTGITQHATSSDPWAQKWLTTNEDGTGPYTLQSLTPGTSFTLVAFNKYWGGWKAGQIKQVTETYVADPAVQKLMIQRGEVDVAENINPADQLVLANQSGTTMFKYPVASNMWDILFDASAPPLNNVLVRQAITYAVDYSAYPKIVLGVGTRGYGPIPSFMAPYFTNQYTPNTNLTKAGQLLDQAGWTLRSDGLRYNSNGAQLKLTYVNIVPGDMTRENMGVQLAADLAKVGITVTVLDEQSATVIGAINQGQHPGQLYSLGVYGYYDIVGYVSLAFNAANVPYWNLGRYNDTTVNSLLKQYITTSDVTQRIQIASELQRITTQSNPAAIFILQTPEPSARIMASWVHGRVYNAAYWRSLNVYSMWLGPADPFGGRPPAIG